MCSRGVEVESDGSNTMDDMDEMDEVDGVDAGVVTRVQ